MADEHWSGSDSSSFSRRTALGAGMAGVAILVAGRAAATPPVSPAALGEPIDPIQLELVMNLVVTCGPPEPMGPGSLSKDGKRQRVWPILGGRFWGPRLAGRVLAGGGDFPILRPDGVMVVDALYRLQENDGTQIIVHNVGLAYPPQSNGRRSYRLAPTFTTVEGPHDWLQRSLFMGTLIVTKDMPDSMRLAKGGGENDRLIQVFRAT